ncbi:MAG: PssD/Cps14F family polysaccharide biosynthesis glycosyltransferase [Candidatus Limnocylindria bacterium]
MLARPPRRARTRKRSQRSPRVALVCSSGGHLMQLTVLRDWWKEKDRFWVTFDTADATSALDGERTYWCHHPTNRNLVNLVRNTILASRILARERPTHIVSTGAAIAVPFFYLGRLLGAKLIYLEVFDRVDGPTLTGQLVRPITHDFLIQWDEQARFYPGAEVVGPVL